MSRDRAELLNEVFVEVALTYFRVQAEADRLSAEGLSAGKVGILRTLHEQGETTVPAIARSRPVARQGVQRNADDLEAAGLIEYVANPRHRRSKLLRLTAKGEKAYVRARDAQLAWAAWVDDEAESERALQTALRVLRWCKTILAS